MKEKKQKNKKKTPHESVQSNIQIAEIYHGVVITKDSRFIKIMEIAPIPFTLYTTKEQYNVAKNFENVITQCPRNVQFTAITLPANLSAQRTFLSERLEKEEKQSVKRMAQEYNNIIVNHEQSSLQRRFFISFEFIRDYSMLEVPTYDSICDNLNEKARQIEVALNSCGNTVIHHGNQEDSIDERYKAEDDAIEEILYQILNRHAEQSYQERKAEVLKKYKDFAEEKGMDYSDLYVLPTEYIAPFSIDFRNSSYVVVNNDTYYTFAYFPSDGYAMLVNPGWLTPYINTDSGVDINIYLERDMTDNRRRKIMNSIKYSKGDLIASKEDSVGAESAEDALNAGRYLSEGMRNGRQFYYGMVMFTISGSSPLEVEKKLETIQRLAKAQRIKLDRFKYLEEQAFFSSLPFGRMDRDLIGYAKRNMLEDGASSLYPFTTPEFIDPQGILFGVDETTQTPVMPNPWNNSMFVNMNVGIFGTSGGGKTVTTLTLATRMRMLQIPIIIFACEKQHEYQWVTKSVGGQFISLATGSKDCINIMEILPRDESVDDSAFADGGSRSYLEAKVESLVKWVELKTGKLSPADETQLNIAIHNTYAKEPFCITEDNASLIDPNDPEGKKFKKMPILEDLYNTLLQNQRTQRIAEVMSYFIEGSGKNWNGQTNVDLSNKFIVFGLEGMSESDFPVALYLAMDYVWAKVKENSKQHKAIFFDEFWKVCESPSAVKLATQMIRLVRAYSCSMVVATQSLGDLMKFDNGETGKTLLENTATKMLLKTTEDNAQMIGNLLHLTNDQIKRLSQQTAGHCLFSSAGTYIHLNIVNGYIERMLFYTDDATKNERDENKEYIEKLLFSDDEMLSDAEAYQQLIDKMTKISSIRQSTINGAKKASSSLVNLLSGRDISEEIQEKKSEVKADDEIPTIPIEMLGDIDELIIDDEDDKSKEVETPKEDVNYYIDDKTGEKVVLPDIDEIDFS
jgi:conjugal transfer ATP-binding protein TraC